jgi:hypothetical protein
VESHTRARSLASPGWGGRAHDMRVNGPKLKLRTTRILRPCSFVSDWWVGTIPTRIASLIYINFD